MSNSLLTIHGEIPNSYVSQGELGFTLNAGRIHTLVLSGGRMLNRPRINPALYLIMRMAGSWAAPHSQDHHAHGGELGRTP